MKGKKSILKVLTSAGMLALASASVSTVSAAENISKSKYYTAYETEEEAVNAAVKLQRRIAGEGDVLLKNKDNALPLSSSAKISVFGGRQNNVLGVSKSSGGTSSGSGGIGLCSALNEAGFDVNPTLENYYQNNATSIGKENTDFTGRVESSLNFYNDAAIVMFSREGGEGSDASRVTSEVTDEDDFEHQALYSKDGKTYKHYLMLTNEEEDLLKYVKSHFKKVVVVINSSNAMEVSNLKKDDGISAIINIGRPGEGGLYGLADILNGTVSPSGSLVDEWMTDFTTDPTWYNFGSNNQTGGENSYYYEDKTAAGTAGTTTSHDNEGYHGVDYEEGIYLGYKYYETIYTEIASGNITYDSSKPLGKQLIANEVSTGLTDDNILSAEAWWKKNVAYQYGYGLTYTDFSFNISGVYTNEKCTSTLSSTGLADKVKSTASKAADIKTIYVKVKVKNTGNVAGKKTVQLYVTTPYTKGGVEKASVSLVGFGKTSLLAPGQSEDVVVAVNMQDIASYDYKNLSGVVGSDGGYVLEQGEYVLRAMDSSHYSYQTDKSVNTDTYDESTFTLDKSVELVQDDYSGNEVKNLFSSGTIGTGAAISNSSTKDNIYSGGVTEEKMHDIRFNSVRTSDMMADGGTGMTILSRGNMVSTFPQAPTEQDHVFKNSVLNYFSYWDNFRASTEYEIDGNGYESNKKVRDASHDYETDPWYKSSVPANWTQATGTYDENHMVENNRTKTKYPMYVSTAKEDTIKFIQMKGLSIDDSKWDLFLNQLTYDELCSIIEFGGYSTVDIKSVGKGQTKDTDGPNNLDGTVAWTSEDILAATFNVDLAYEEGEVMGNIGLLHGVEGWYGPGADTHRSPFSGRNNEYYSQDAIHAGYMGAAEVQGVQSTGVIPYIKHCLMNDMETDRGTMFVWADEQTIRESGAKQFQIILQEGGCKAAMTGYARLCGLNNTNNYNLGVELYQNQWGSNAYFVTDGYIGWRTRTDLDSMVRTGNQMELYTTPFVEYLSGEWKADANSANGGMVYVEDLNSDAEDHMVASPTQWYWVRKSAQAILYQVANSAGQFNGYSELSIEGGQLSATQGVAVNNSLSIANMLTSGSSVSYSAVGLPQGLTLNAYTGNLSGKVTSSGTYNFTVNYAIDGWINKSANYTLTVVPSIKLADGSDDLLKLKVGDEVYAQITSDIYKAGSNYNTVTYSLKSGKLPAGVTLDENGLISGAPTEAGTFDIVVDVTAIKITSSKKGEERTETHDEFVTQLVIAGQDDNNDPVTDPIDDVKKELQTEIDKINERLDKTSTKEDQTQISNQITELQKQISSSKTTTLVMSIVAIVLAVITCGTSLFVVLKKKNN